jgi:hypothetical protein
MNQDSAAFLRAVRGPVMMITVGILFALDNFTQFGFSRTWPVLLVVSGILSLGGGGRMRGKFRYQAQWGPPRPPVYPGAPVPPPPAAPPVNAPSGPPTAGPGTYRGSTYEATPASATPRGTEPKANPPGTGVPQ